jgi:hypothetical protein
VQLYIVGTDRPTYLRYNRHAWMVVGIRSMGRVRVEHLDPRIQMVNFHVVRHRHSIDCSKTTIRW